MDGVGARQEEEEKSIVLSMLPTFVWIRGPAQWLGSSTRVYLLYPSCRFTNVEAQFPEASAIPPSVNNTMSSLSRLWRSVRVSCSMEAD